MVSWFSNLRKNRNTALVHTPGKQRLTLTEIATTGGSLRIRDMSNTLWFPAGQPITPVAPKGTPPRRYAFQPLTNINFSGRDGALEFATLRRFSNYSIVRAIIESVLDRLCSETWDFRLVQEEGEKQTDYKERNASDPRLQKLRQVFRKPDGWQNFRAWSRGLYDDMLTIDAASVWEQRDTKGKIASHVQIDGALVFPLVDETGQQPDPNRVLVQTGNKKATKSYLEKVKSKGGKIVSEGESKFVNGGSPAFQLTPYGYPAQEMTANELIYAVRNRKTFRKYGFSIVEQAIAIIALGLARQDFQAAYYQSGNVPEFIAFLPPDVPPSKAEELNGYLDSILTGQLGNRRKGFFLPSYGTEKSPNIVFPKANDEVLKDMFDEWLARVLCFFFGMSPTAFVKQTNRATAEQMSEESEEQGLQPYLDWMKDLLNEIVQVQYGFEDIEAVTGSRKEQDALKQAEIDQIKLKNGMVTLDELRERNGDDPFDLPETKMPCIITATGIVPWDGSPLSNAPPPPEPMAPMNGNGKKPPPKGQPPKKKAPQKSDSSEDDSRHNWPTLSPGILTAKSHSARVRTEIALQKCFRAAKAAAIRGVNGLVARPSRKAEKILADMLLELRKRDFDSVQFNLDKDDAEKIRQICLKDEDLDEKGRELHPHVTVLFGFRHVRVDEVEEKTKGIGKITITFGDLIAFPEGDHGVPLVVKVHSDKLHELHDKLSEIPNHDSHPEYIPHICVGYVKKGTEDWYLERVNPYKGDTAVLSQLVFSRKNGEMVPLEKLRKDSPEDPDDADSAASELWYHTEPHFSPLASELQMPYEDSALSGVQQGALQMQIEDAGMLSSLNYQASEWARDRAAELVGMKRDLEGNLIANPDAKWAITETTRNDLRRIVTDAFKQDTDWAEVKNNLKAGLESSETFSDARAALIARTEIGRSQMGSTLDVWKRSGFVKRLRWEATGIEPCPECLMNDQQEVDFGQPFPSGAYSILDSHPRCSCLVTAVGFESA
jgi:2'-5' RNA ligase